MLRLLTAVALACLLVACGGGGGEGGGSGGDDTPVDPVAPSATTAPIDPLSGILTLSPPLGVSWTLINSIPVRTPAGTTAYAANLTVGPLPRRYVVIRPHPKPVSAPLLMILHPRDTTPELTANFHTVQDTGRLRPFFSCEA